MNQVIGQDGAGIIRNAGWLFFDKVVRLGLNFLLTAYIARYVGVEEFGLWNYAIAFVALFSFTSTLGMYQLLLRDFVKSHESKFEILRNAFTVKLIGGGFTLLLSLLTIYILKKDDSFLRSLVFIVGIGYVAQSLDVIDYFFQSQLKSKLIAWSRALSFGLFGILKLYFIYSQQPLIFFVWAQSGELLLAGLFLLLFFNNNFKGEWRFEANVSQIKSILFQSAPILFAEIAILVYMRIDQVMIGEMLGNRSLGNYSAAVKLSEIWYLFPGVICGSMFPSIIRAHASNPDLYKRKLQLLYDILAWLSIGIGLGISLMASNLVNLIYGPEFREAAPILVIHVWSGLFVFWGTASGQQLVIENFMKISFYRTVIGLIVNIGLNFWLIPAYGAYGAAIATLVSYGFSAWISNLFFKSTQSIFWMNLRSLNLLRIIRAIRLQSSQPL